MRSRERWGLYEPGTHHDACGVGFVAHIKGKKSRDIVDQALEILLRLSHRAACGADPKTGDGAESQQGRLDVDAGVAEMSVGEHGAWYHRSCKRHNHCSVVPVSLHEM